MKPTISLNIGQNLNITPQLQQAIKLLQLSSLELEGAVQEMLESNTMLEASPSDGEAEGQSAVDNDIEAFWDKHGWSEINGKKGNPDTDFNIFENYAKDEHNLKSHLRWQLNFCKWSEQKLIIADAIIENLHDDGSLCASMEDILKSLPRPISDLSLINDTIYEVQRLDPIGVAARSTRECLLIQLESLPTSTKDLNTAKHIIQDHLNSLANKYYKKITMKLNISDDQLFTAVRLIGKLDLKPGHKIHSEASEYIVPDLTAFKYNNEWKVMLNRELNTQIRINPSYSSLVKRANNSRDNIFLQEQLREARWFLKSLHNRNETILKVASSIMQKQMQFLEHGTNAMQPLVLSAVAQATELHESTISRVTTNKYIHTPQGVFELKYFFSSCISTTNGDECSSVAIRAMIKTLILDEDERKPYSDQSIADILMEKNSINIARRTVAKYREMLGIPPSNLRKAIPKHKER